MRIASISSILLFLLGFFLPWGSGTQNILDSRIFILASWLIIAYWVIFKECEIVFPRYFNIFILFVILHTVFTYLYFKNEVTFGYTNLGYLPGDHSVIISGVGITIFRQLSFFVLAYAIGSILKNFDKLKFLAFGCGLGLTGVILQNGYFFSYGLTYRYSGGYLDPNAFGTTAFLIFFLNLFIVKSEGTTTIQKCLSLIFMLMSLWALFLSGSRTALIGTIIGIFIAVFSLYTIKKRLFFLGMLFIFFILFLFYMPQNIKDSLGTRVDLSDIKSTNMSLRIDIWMDYIRALPNYVFSGVGFNRSIEATKDSFRTIILYIPHNLYLQILVEFGIIGFILFIKTLHNFFHLIYKKIKIRDKSYTPVLFGLYVGFLVMFISGNYFDSRDLWIVFGIIAGGINLSKTIRINIITNK